MHNENSKKTNWAIATTDDITEIKNVLEYVRGLVIKSTPIAEAYETIQSTRKATLYVSAVLKLNDTDDLNSSARNSLVLTRRRRGSKGEPSPGVPPLRAA